jgi:hypothetical protein
MQLLLQAGCNVACSDHTASWKAYQINEVYWSDSLRANVPIALFHPPFQDVHGQLTVSAEVRAVTSASSATSASS